MGLEILHYGFALRGLEAGFIVALIAPLIGIFLVLRRYSLIADTLAHVSLAGVAIGMLAGIDPLFSALGVVLVASFGIERLRISRRVFGESALALFLSGSLALAVVILSIGHGFNTDLFSFLFGSITTVTPTDVLLITILAVVVAVILALFFKELVYVTFDEEAARVSGVPTRLLNIVLMLLAALTVALAIPIVGVLLIAALIVVPVVTALQLQQSFAMTIVSAEIISVLSVLSGMVASFYLNISTGGTIVLITLAIFAVVMALKNK